MEKSYTTKLDDEIDLVAMGSILLSHKKFIFIFTSIFAIASIFIALILPVTYKSSAIIIESEPSSSTPNLGGMASLVGLDVGEGSSKTVIALEVLKSRKFFIDFANKRDAIPLMLASNWNEDNNTLLWPEGFSNESKQWIDGAEPTKNYVYKNVYLRTLGIVKDPISNIIEISYIHSSPHASKKIVDWLITDLNEQLKNEDLLEAEKSLEYLNNELEKAQTLEIRNLITSMIKNKLQVTTIANSREDYRFKILDPAIAPEMKYKPVRSIVCIVITMIGFFTSIMLVFIYNYYNKLQKS